MTANDKVPTLSMIDVMLIEHHDGVWFLGIRIDGEPQPDCEIGPFESRHEVEAAAEDLHNMLTSLPECVGEAKRQ